MLGEQLGEETGKVTGLRVLPGDGDTVRLEVSFQASGKMLGEDVTDMGTYWSVIRPDGTLYGEGQGVIMTKKGEMATWVGQGSGRFTGHGSAVDWRGTVHYRTSAKSLSKLNGIAAAFEYNVDENNNTHAKLFEWK